MRLEDMNALFGDATTAMPTPATQAERGSLMGVGSPASLDLRRGNPEPGMFSTSDAIPGLDIDPPHLDIGDDGKPIKVDSSRGRSANGGEGIGAWIGRMVSRTRREGSGSSRGGGNYGRVAQDEE